MIRTTLVLALGLAAALPALSVVSAEEPVAAVKAEASATVTLDVEVSDEEALEDDILLVIDLPILVADARDSGVDEEEIEAVLTTVSESAVSAAVTAELVLAETEATKEKGKRKGLHLFVRRHLVAGMSPKEIAAKVRDREEVLEDMTDEERAALEKKIDELRDLNERRRKARHDKRKSLVAQGQVIRLIAHEAHDQRKEALMQRKEELAAARAAHKDARMAHKDAAKEHGEAREDHREAVEAIKAAETPEEKAAAKDDLKAAKDARKEAKDAHKEAVKDRKEAAKDHKKAHGEAKKARAETKKDGPGGPGGPGGKKKGG